MTETPTPRTDAVVAPFVGTDDVTVAECDALLDHARDLEREFTAERAARERAEAKLLCPGQMRCAKCKFELTRRTLFVQSGTVGAGTSETEPCPNGCGPLWPVTWEQEARGCYVAMDRLFDEKQQAVTERDAARAEAKRLRGIIHDSYMALPIPPGQMAFADDLLTPHVRAVADEWAIRERQLAAEKAESERLREALRTARAEALEEAASICETIGKDIVCPEECAAAIRAAKEGA